MAEQTKQKKRSTRQRKSRSSKKRAKALVDIIVPFYGRTELVEQVLEAIPGAIGEISYKVILVDDGSLNQEGREFFNGLSSDYKKIWQKENSGFPAAVNAGFHAGFSPLIFVWSSDVVMDPGSIVEAVKEMDDPEIGMVGCKLLFPEGCQHGPPGTVQHAGMAFSLSGKPMHIFSAWPADHPKVNQRRELNLVTGAAFMTRRNLFIKAGGLNTIYGKGTYEDMEYCLQMKNLDKKVVYSPLVSGTHSVGGSLGQEGAPGFALEQNFNMFMSRMMPLVEWDEWRIW